MADFTLPINTSLYTSVLDLLKDRDVDAGTLCVSAPTNPPTGMFKYVRADNKFQEYNGATWDDKVLAVAGGGTGGATASAARTSLGLGSIATQNSNNVTITGGSISGVSLSGSDISSGTVALARGGTGASLSLGAAGTVLRSNGSAVAFSTDGSALTALNASNLSSGTVSASRLPDIEWDKIVKVSEGKRGAVSMFTNDVGYVTAATAGMPIGAIIDYGGIADIAPWFVCDGRLLNRVAFSALYSVIGLRFTPVDDGVNFNIPNFANRSSVGPGTYNLGEAIGSLVHTHSNGTLSNETLVGHTHPISGTSGPSSGHSHASLTGSLGSSSGHTHGNTGETTPPNHHHTGNTSEKTLTITTAQIYNGDGSSEDVIISITNPHYHSFETAGVEGSDLKHLHSTGGETGHSHGVSALATSGETGHTHGGGNLQATSDGGHTHMISGNTGQGTHACLVTNKLIKYA